MQIKDPGFFTRGKVSLTPNPQITVEAVQQDLMANFPAPNYEVYKTALIGADLVLKKSGFTGVALKVKHTGQETTILFNPFAPSAFARMLFMGFIPLLVLYLTSWKTMIADFKSYVQRSRLLNQ